MYESFFYGVLVLYYANEVLHNYKHYTIFSLLLALLWFHLFYLGIWFIDKLFWHNTWGEDPS